MKVVIMGSLVILINSLSQVMLKKGADKAGMKQFPYNMITLFSLLGYSGFFIVTLINAFLLKEMDMKYLIIITTLNYLCTLILAILFVKEKITKNKMIGILFIMTGAVIFYL